MDIMEYTRTLRESRMRVANELQSLVDDAYRAHPGESFTGEEQQKFDRLNERLNELESTIRSLDEQDRRERESAVSTEAIERQVGVAGRQNQERSEAQRIVDWLQGRERRSDGDDAGKNAISVNLSRAAREKELIRQGASAEEVRSLLWDTGNVASAVPTLMDRSIYSYLEQAIAMMAAPTTMIMTDSGANLDFPKVTTHAVATQVKAQGTAIGGTDPAFGKMTLNAFKYGELVQIASEVVQDAAVDIINFVAREVSYATGRVIDADLVTGVGSTTEPLGIMAAGSVTTTTGGSLIDPSYEKLVDLAYSVPTAYAGRGSMGWLMKQNTAGVLRKLRDGAGGTVGAVLWSPSLTAGIQGGQPDQLLGYNVWLDTNVAALASDSKSVGFGDFSAYYIRTVGDFVIERSDDYAFNTDLVTFRGKWRVDGDLIDTAGPAWAVMQRNV